MKKEIQTLIDRINHRFDKVHYVVKKERSLQSLNKTLLSNAKKYKENINDIQKLYSTNKNKIFIDHQSFELVACSIGAKGIKYSSFGSSHRILPAHKYLKPIKTLLLNKLGQIGHESNRTRTPNIIGKCAEVKAFNNLLKRESKLSENNVIFTKAIRPRTLEKILRCENCEKIFGYEN
ncbi:hypothetical protein [Flavobacterium cerinum]|uniref:Uncharacterized protein n=1 Tax=Flavobacterium cerinum TaxID=2502784 RepID=A0ABY5IP68_9FLAO|nr:hypothetical protein [Flavobacterium cerinum]UUC44030.1 hypothetical protein NOX80_10340 [Flavobacterium cerinum]